MLEEHMKSLLITVLVVLFSLTSTAQDYTGQSFTTGSYPPAEPPIQLSPADGEKVDWVSGVLVFQPGDFNEVWHLQVASDSTYSNVIEERLFGYISDTLWVYDDWDGDTLETFDPPPDTVDVIEYPIFNLDYNTTYWWRVRSWNESGWGDWSGN